MATAGAPPSGGILSNLAALFSNPQTYNWLGGVGAGLSRAGHGQGFDITGANTQFLQALQNEKAKEKLNGLMQNFDLSTQQRQFLQSLPLQAQQKILARQQFGGGDSKLGLNIVWGRDAQGNYVPMQADPRGGLRAAGMPEGVTPVQPWNSVPVDTGMGTVFVNPRNPYSPQTAAGGPPSMPSEAPAGAAPSAAPAIAPVPGGGAYVPKDVEGKAAASARGAATGQEEITTRAQDRQAAEAAGGLISQIDSALNDPALPQVTGPIQGRLPNVLPSSTRVQTKLDNIKSKAFMQAFQSLKGGGQITEREGQAATAAITRLGSENAQNMNDQDYRDALLELRKIGENAIKRSRGEKVDEYISPTIKWAGVDLTDDEKKQISGAQPGSRVTLDGRVFIWDGESLVPQS